MSNYAEYIQEIASPGPGQECGECGDWRTEEDGWHCSCDMLDTRARDHRG